MCFIIYIILCCIYYLIKLNRGRWFTAEKDFVLQKQSLYKSSQSNLHSQSTTMTVMLAGYHTSKRAPWFLTASHIINLRHSHKYLQKFSELERNSEIRKNDDATTTRKEPTFIKTFYGPQK